MMVRETQAEADATTTTAPKVKISSTQRDALKALSHLSRTFVLPEQVKQEMIGRAMLAKGSPLATTSVLRSLERQGLVTSHINGADRFAITSEGLAAIGARR